MRPSTTRRQEQEAVLARQLAALTRECLHLFERSSAAIEAALAPRVNRDDAIRRDTLRALETRYFGAPK